MLAIAHRGRRIAAAVGLDASKSFSNTHCPDGGDVEGAYKCGPAPCHPKREQAGFCAQQLYRSVFGKIP